MKRLKNNKSVIYFIFKSILISVFVCILGLYSTKTSYADTIFYFCNNNNGTNWEVNVFNGVADGVPFSFKANRYNAYLYSESQVIVDSACKKFGSYENLIDVHKNNITYDNNSSFKWLTACVDPPYTEDPEIFGTIYGSGAPVVKVDVTCKTGYPNSHPLYGACNQPNNHNFVDSDAKCPGSGPVCTWGGINWSSNCVDQCVGANECTYRNKTCTSSGCNSNDTDYATRCNDRDASDLTQADQNSNRCAPPPPANLTETTSCNGTAGTDQASVIRFNWNAIPYDSCYDVRYRPTSQNSGWEKTISSCNGSPYGGNQYFNGTSATVPGNACDTGPGGCSFPYDKAYEWEVRGHTSGPHSGPTDWRGPNAVRTNDCSGKPDLRVTAFSFQGGNSAGTTDAVVTIINSGYSGTGGQFDVKVNNGNGQSVSVRTNALGVDQSRTLTVPNVPRPNAGSYTATAIVDPKDNGINNTDDIDEVNETNNDRNDPYNTTSNIGGTIFIDDNPTNGTRDAGEGLYTSSINIKVGSVNYTGTVGTYKSGELDAGVYNVTMPTVPTNYTLTTPTTVQKDLGPNRTVDFGLKLIQSNIIIDVFEDYDGNGVFDSTAGNQDKVYPGATITVTGQGSAGSPYTTNASGRVTLSNLNLGNSNITLTVPGSYTLTTPKPPAPNNAITITVPPTGQTVNFGIQPPAPYCAGGLTANPSSVRPGSGVTSALTCVNPTSPNGDPVSYAWFSDGVGTVDNVNSATSTWRSPISTAATVTNPSVRICYQGTNRCGSSTTPITIIQRFTITGQVFEDKNENGIWETALGESAYTENVTITATPVNGSSSTDVNGAYTISNLPASSYTISYIDLPSTYRISYPQGLPPSFTVTVGSQANCTASIAGYNSATCTNGSISNLNFGIITNAGSWIQSGGSDIWFNNGLTNSIPSGASCQSYASLNGPGGTPGIVYSGIGSADLGSGQASANPYNWKVGGISSYSESYGPASAGSPLATSYSYIKNLATTNGTPPTLLTTAHCGALGIVSCNLSPTLASGVYEAVGNLTLANNYAFPANRNYVILVSENLRLKGTIDVPDVPVGSTVLFSVQGNIYVSPNVGTNNVNSTTPHLEGWFSTDHSFYVEGGNTCPTRDNRLNVEGAIIVNASLQGGSFYNDRDLCSQNSNCPVFYIKERPDFTLNAPRFLKNAPRVYKEVAP